MSRLLKAGLALLWLDWSPLTVAAAATPFLCPPGFHEEIASDEGGGLHICRNDNGNGGFMCPQGYLQSPYPPYCLERVSAPCTVHTYFQPQKRALESDVAGNQETIASWRKAWESRGWNTRVLTEHDARAHSDFPELYRAFKKLPTVNAREYEVACFIRHLAMTVAGGGWMSDYDVVPLAIPACAPLSNEGRFTTHQGFVPSLVSATADEYLRVTKLMAASPWRENPATFQTRDGRPIVSDMKALAHLQATNAIEVFPEPGTSPRCGVVEAIDVYALGHKVDCLANCAALTPEPGFSKAAWWGRDAKRTHGPLASHLSHASMTTLAKQAASLSALGFEHGAPRGGTSRSGHADHSWLPQSSELFHGLASGHGTVGISRGLFHQTRAALLVATPAAYTEGCAAHLGASAAAAAAPRGDGGRGGDSGGGLRGGVTAEAAQETAQEARVVARRKAARAARVGGSGAAVEHAGEDCHARCHGETGQCPSFCGASGACCKAGDGEGVAACGFGGLGCSEFHCCIAAAS